MEMGKEKILLTSQKFKSLRLSLLYNIYSIITKRLLVCEICDSPSNLEYIKVRSVEMPFVFGRNLTGLFTAWTSKNECKVA